MMNKTEMKVKASIFMFYVDANGVETNPERCTIGGKKIEGAEEVIFARTGQFPNYSKVVALDEAQAQFAKWWGFALETRLRDGKSLHLVSRTDSTRKYETAAAGDVILEVVYDIRNTSGSAARYKMIYTKA